MYLLSHKLYKKKSLFLAKNELFLLGKYKTRENGKILAKGHNTREFNHDILGHAEINVIREASKILKRWNLADCELYVTLKPCSMCTEIIKQSRILKVFYLLDKLDYKKEFSKSEFFKIESSKNEQMYHKMISDFFKDKR